MKKKKGKKYRAKNTKHVHILHHTQYDMKQFQILLHATELKLLYTAEMKESPSDT